MNRQVYRHAESRDIQVHFDLTVLRCEGERAGGAAIELALPPAANGSPGYTLLVERHRKSIKRSPGTVEIHARLADAANKPVRLTRRLSTSGFEFVLAG